MNAIIVTSSSHSIHIPLKNSSPHLLELTWHSALYSDVFSMKITWRLPSTQFLCPQKKSLIFSSFKTDVIQHSKLVVQESVQTCLVHSPSLYQARASIRKSLSDFSWTQLVLPAHLHRSRKSRLFPRAYLKKDNSRARAHTSNGVCLPRA